MLFPLPHMLCVGWAGPDGAGGFSAVEERFPFKATSTCTCSSLKLCDILYDLSVFTFCGRLFVLTKACITYDRNTVMGTWADVEMINNVYRPASFTSRTKCPLLVTVKAPPDSLSFQQRHRQTV